MATRLEIAKLLRDLLDLNLKGAITEAFIGECVRRWSHVPLPVWQAAVAAWVEASSFVPTVAELSPLIERELALASASPAEAAAPQIDPELLFEYELSQALLRQPPCAGRCEGTGLVLILDDEENLSLLAYNRRRALDPSALPEARERDWQPCPDGCDHGRQPLPHHEIAQLRARLFNQPQPATKRKAVKS